jgi:hypothetical protein
VHQTSVDPADWGGGKGHVRSLRIVHSKQCPRPSIADLGDPFLWSWVQSTRLTSHPPDRVVGDPGKGAPNSRQRSAEAPRSCPPWVIWVNATNPRRPVHVCVSGHIAACGLEELLPQRFPDANPDPDHAQATDPGDDLLPISTGALMVGHSAEWMFLSRRERSARPGRACSRQRQRPAETREFPRPADVVIGL